MNFLDLKDISEKYIELLNPTSAEKILLAGKMAGLKPGSRVIEFGCGYGEVLALWGKHYGITGVGIEIRPLACQRARQKMAEKGLEGRIEIAEGPGAEYAFEPYSYDVGACVGASFVWGEFSDALRALRKTLKPGGTIIIGEPYWVTDAVPPEWAQDQKDIHTELQLLQIARAEGFEFSYILHSSLDDWDRYEAANWYGLLRWLADHPDHPERHEVINHLHESQEEYLTVGRKYLGWALIILETLSSG